MMISRLGHAVDAVADGIAVVEAVLNSDYDVVLMDVHMPLMDGLEATRRIRRLPPPFRQPLIVALTASASAADRVACAEVGMDDYLANRFDALNSRRARLVGQPHLEPGSLDVDSFA